jgi:hypothetical protein
MVAVVDLVGAEQAPYMVVVGAAQAVLLHRMGAEQALKAQFVLFGVALDITLHLTPRTFNSVIEI